MPRAKKPNWHLKQPGTTVTLSDDARIKLIDILHLNQRPDLKEPILASIEQILNLCRDRARHAKVGPRSLLAELDPVLSRVQDLQRRMERLSEHSKALLVAYGLTKDHDNALEQIATRFEAATRSVRNHAKAGRPLNWPLSLAMFDLFLLYNQVRGSQSNSCSSSRQIVYANRDARHFISDALNAASIPHPDPDEEVTHFNSLLRAAVKKGT